jgi:D-3-phosphoglycerate dehydrogenase / 2-oxoglutarate reductase
MTRFSVLNASDITACPDAFDPLSDMADVESRVSDQAWVAAHLRKYDVYFASLHVQLTREIIASAPRLKVIVTPSTGTDHIDMAYAKERGIPVLTLKEERAFLDNVTATAEQAWALLLAVVRRVPWAFAAAQRGEWARDRFRGHQLSGMTLGILGYGRLGTIVADYGLAFRMRVLACDVRPVTPKPGVTMVDFEALLRESDVLTIHIHLTEANRRLINASAFGLMKLGAFLINTSRGAIIDEAAFVEALESGRLGGAGVDVIEGEWRSDLAEHPLVRYAREHENLVISPHVGGVTFESQSMAYRFMVEKLRQHLLRKVSSV